MKIIRFFYKDKISYGILNADYVQEIERFSFSKEINLSKNTYSLNKIKILSPVLPNKVIGLAYNYKDLVGERVKYDDPLVFMKSPTSIIGNNESIIIPSNKKVWVEVELVIVIGNNIKQKYSTFSEKIFGYTIGNDVTVESKYGRDHHLAQSKARNTFGPLGPYIETEINTSKLNMTNKINNQTFQKGNTGNRIFNDEKCVELVESIMNLEPGDLIFTGTPANAENSVVKKGDVCDLSIDGLSSLSNKII
tara:strand:+ start:2942 stop:3691 length:750 start_codon:yes stop_codon:yes gene_type:complete